MPYSKVRPKEKRTGTISGRELGRYNMTKWLCTTGVAALLAFVVGCSGGGEAPSASVPAPSAAAGETAAVGPAPPAAEKPEAPAASSKETGEAAPEKADKNNISVASPQAESLETETPDDLYMNEDDRQQMKSAEEARQEFNRRNYDVTGTFDPLHPTLMGIAIGADAAVVTQRFGEPNERYKLPDESEDASVYAYPGFTVGVRDKQVLFVEVSTRSVNPGLNGLRLGDAREDAVTKLGTPTADSEFVMNYVADGAVLKLDLDPESNKIHSMKLFPEE